MAFVKKEDVNSSATSENTATLNQNSNPQTVQITSFSNLIDEFLVGGSLSQDANNYIKHLREILEDKTNSLEIKVKKINRVETSYLFSYHDFGIILIFDDNSIQDIYQIAKNDLINNAISAAKMMQQDIKILNAIIITNNDYLKYNQMADYINGVFRIYTSSVINNITVDSFGIVDRNRNIIKTDSLVIDVNLDNVKAYIETKSPMGIPARMDIGLICYKVQGTKNQNNNDSRYSKKQKLFALSAYTELVPDSFTSGKPIFTPVIHITDIVTPLMFPGILPIAMLVGAEVFGAYKLWQTPYMKIKKGTVNIGNLLIDKNNKPKAVSNEKELAYLFAEHFTPPAIVLDVTEGRARIPSITLFAANNKDQLSNVFKTFLNISNNEPLRIIGKAPTQEIIGTTKISGIVPNAEVIDTRYIDYLNIVNLLGYDNRTAELFQKYVLDPLKKIELVKSITNETSFMYLNNEILLNGVFLKYLVEAMAGHINIINPLNNNLINTIDIKSLVDNTYSAGPSLSAQSSTLPMTGNFRYGLF